VNVIWSAKLIWTWNDHVILNGYCDGSCFYYGYCVDFVTCNNKFNTKLGG